VEKIAPQHRILEFGKFRLQLDALLLMCGTDRVEIAPKALQILAVLARNAGCVVSKDDLLDVVWPDTVVEEGNLAVHISALRKALDSHANGNECIQTVPKRGYIFTAAVSELQSDFPPAGRLSSTEQLHCIAAHYLRQRTILGCRRAIHLFTEQLRKFPNDCRAQIGLADALYLGYELGLVPIATAMWEAFGLLDSAAKIDPLSSDNSMIRAKFKESCDWQWNEAEHGYSRAIDLTPSYGMAHALYGRHLARRGEFAHAAKHFQTALALDPLSPEIRKFQADSLWLARDFKGALAATEEALQMHPDSWLVQLPMARTHLAFGNYSKCLPYYRRAILHNPGHKLTILAEVAYAHACAGMPAKAISVLARIQKTRVKGQYVSPVAIARVHSALGNKNQSLELLEEACAQKDMFVSWLKEDSRIDPLRPIGRFQSLLTRIGM
jgi:DNA-binding winged helix-turn-helix (wHTH) protein/Tfp pilus assembly protein PilF